MISSLSDKTNTGEPSSYQQMEDTLAKVVARAGEDTREGKSTEAPFLPKTTDGDVEGADNVLKTNSDNHASDYQVEEKVSSICSQDEKTNNLSSIKSQTVVCSTPVAEPETNPPAPSQANAEASPSTSQTAGTSENKRATSSSQRNGTEPAQATAMKSGSHATCQDDSKHASPTPLKSYSSIVTGERVVSDEDYLRKKDSSGPPRVIHAEMPSRLVASHPLQISSSPPQVLAMGTSPKSKSETTLRRGKWTMEEEAYVARVIQDFNSGFLNAPAGTTLRSYLSEKLQCDPMRITKKFTGDACIGKRVFHPAVRSAGNAASIDKTQAELDALERRWRRRLEIQQRESAKKAAASVAAATASSQGGGGHGLIQGVPVALLSGADPQGASTGSQHIRQNVVTQAASWLDRANALLKGTKTEGSNARIEASGAPPAGQSFDSMPSAEIKIQMKEVQRLIYEGPLIQQTAAGLPHLLNNGEQAGAADPFNGGSPVAPAIDHILERSVNVGPADKRMRRASASGAEDAEALVGFLRSVRESAAAGQDM